MFLVICNLRLRFSDDNKNKAAIGESNFSYFVKLSILCTIITHSWGTKTNTKKIVVCEKLSTPKFDIVKMFGIRLPRRASNYLYLGGRETNVDMHISCKGSMFKITAVNGWRFCPVMYMIKTGREDNGCCRVRMIINKNIGC